MPDARHTRKSSSLHKSHLKTYGDVPLLSLHSYPPIGAWVPGFSFDDDILTLKACVRFVRRFHQRIKAPIAATPQTLKCDPASALMFSGRLTELSKELAAAANGTEDVLLCRAAMAIEELGEWLAANAKSDLPAAADALGDRLYVLLGDAVATGIPLSEVFEAVHESNSSKLPLVTTGLGKAFKGPDYVAPDLESLLAHYAALRASDPDDCQRDHL